MWKDKAESLLSYLYDKLDEIREDIEGLEEAMRLDDEAGYERIENKISEV